MTLGKQDTYSCPHAGCDRVFKYKAALENHQKNHKDVVVQDGCLEEVGTVKEEEPNPLLVYKEEALTDDGDEDGVEAEEEEEESFENADNELELTPTRIMPNNVQLRSSRRGRKKGTRNKTFKDYKCTDCSKEFIYHKTLLKHCVERHGMSIKDIPPRIKKPKEPPGVVVDGENSKIVCDICGDSFKFKSGLYNHKKRMHFDSEKKSCPHCSRMVKPSFLEQHIKQEHSSPR